MTELQNRLAQLGACEKAVAWVGDKTAQEAWDACENPLWLLWSLDTAHAAELPSGETVGEWLIERLARSRIAV